MKIRRCFLSLIMISLISITTYAQIGTTPVYFKFRTDKVYVLEAGKVEISLDLYVGTFENPVKNLYAGAFDLVFPPDLILADQTTFTYDSQSFWGTSDEVNIFNKAPEALKGGQLNISISRKDYKNINGFGKVGTVSFVTTHDIIGGRNVDESPFTVKGEHIKLWNVDGNELPSETDEEGATVVIVNDILARNAQDASNRQVEIYPNPARDQLYIQLKNLRGQRFEIFNIAGQRVLSDQLRGDQATISTKDLHSGLYLIKIYTQEGTLTRRILLQ